MTDQILPLTKGTDEFRRWQRSFLIDGNESSQKRARNSLLRKIQSSPDDLAQHMLEVALSKDGLKNKDEVLSAVPALSNRLTANETQRTGSGMLPQQIKKIGTDLSCVSAAQAADSLFWFVCYSAWMLRGQIGHRVPFEYFCAPADLSQGKEETAVRNFLRRTGGLHPVSGKVSVLSEHIMGRVLWMHRISERAADTGAVEYEKCVKTLSAGSIWPEFTRWAANRVTTIFHPNAVAGLVLGIDRHLEDEGDPYMKVTKPDIDAAVKALSVHGKLSSLQLTRPEVIAASVEQALSA